MPIVRRNTDYALRALVHLALSEGRVQCVSAISSAEGIPMEFLHKILQKFSRHGIVKSHRGVTGGFSLAKHPGEVSVRDVIEIMQGQLAVNRCLLGEGACDRSDRCSLMSNWIEVQTQIVKFLEGLSLQDLADQARHAGKKNHEEEMG